MYFPSKKEFIKLSRKGNVVPVYREILADMETPVGAFKRIESEYSFLLESVEGEEKIARYSYLGSSPILIFRSKGNQIEILTKGKTKKLAGDPFTIIKDLLRSYKVVKPSALQMFHGGLVGYIGYDAVRFIEKIPDRNPDDLALPDIQLMLTGEILAFDHVKHKIIVISNALIRGKPAQAYKKACSKIEAIVKKLEKPLGLKKTELEISSKPRKLKIDSNVVKRQFKECVSKVKEYVRGGDIIQAVLSQRFETSFTQDPFNVYRVLLTINPSPYMYYLKFKGLRLIGSSPEVMVRLDKGAATVRPIAGTRKRGGTKEDDLKFEKELLASEKERAEHLMLVDLGRNDLGRVCKYGSVKVTDLMTIERYSHVMHIVSNVSGSLKKGKDSVDLFLACFPAGTVTGAPKVRAMEIIDEVENIRRGPYAGAVGYFSFDGELNTCITIRTITICKNKAYVQAGAGIVADSVPEKEYHETINKARALFKAIELTGGES
ncbi:MAG: anthranilate synthase component I [Candidatus Saganbacteria bacterium]|nr:anthranilate synthase component I [Candidatus Saganbacteria bacterium]